jgi:tripartite-type tricarboxylate transporter receptor subunit TctC
MKRRSILFAGAAAALACRGVLAQGDWPSSPIKLVVPFAPGGGNDIFGRLLAKQLQDALQGNVFVDNRSGANGAVGLDFLARSKPDGYTIATATMGALDFTPGTTQKLPFDPAKSFTYLANMVKFPLFLCVSPKLGVKNVQEFIAKAKAQPGKLSYSSAGLGNSTHLAGEVLANMTGTKLLHAPYRGAGPAMAALAAGEVDFTFGSGPSGLSFVKAGKVLNLGVTDSQRVPDMPELKTIAEQGVPGYDVTSWGGIVAPAGLPHEVGTRISAALKQIADSAIFKQQMLDQAMVPSYMAGPEFEAYVARERAKWAQLIPKLGLRDLG